VTDFTGVPGTPPTAITPVGRNRAPRQAYRLECLRTADSRRLRE
jgi:hypothetical protein